jgi:hypothetical protein
VDLPQVREGRLRQPTAWIRAALDQEKRTTLPQLFTNAGDYTVPRLKSWISRVPYILEQLNSVTPTVYTRREVEQLFTIRKVKAIDLMRVAGARIEHGMEAEVTRENLKFYVEHCPEAISYYAEQARRKRMARDLLEKESARDAIVRFSQMIASRLKPADQRIEFDSKKLAECLSIGPGILTLRFSDSHDLAYKMALLAMAGHNDGETLWGKCDPPRGVPFAGEPKYTLLNHPFTTHPTYTGKGCAMCGRPEAVHVDMTGALRLATPEERARIMSEELVA